MRAALLLALALALATSPTLAQDLRPPTEFTGPPAARAAALFREAGRVFTHPRCINCHPAGARPLQGDDSRPHQPPVQRGPDGHGPVGMQCATCHGATNYDPAGIPGDGAWHLAPASMAWEGKSVGEICRQLRDPSRNGGRSLEAIAEHIAKDPLVGWAWHPGGTRTPAPGSQAQLGALVRAWIDAGAHCP